VPASNVIADLRALAARTSDPQGAQRVAWGPVWRDARRWLDEVLARDGLRAETDLAGNNWITLPGARPETVVIGGHLDSVPNGGWLDGALGVLAGVEALLRYSGSAPPPVTLAVVDFADEEGARFSRSLLGSSGASGSLVPDTVRNLVDRQGTRLADALAENGVDVDRMVEARHALDARRPRAYLELHIEQGPVLERAAIDLGVVTAITGMLGFRVRFTGEANHAGTTPMAFRRDALAGAASAVLALRDEARTRDDMTANVGVISAEPGGFNVVPGAAELTIDVRSATADGFARLEPFVRGTLERIAAEEELGLELRETHRKQPVALDSDLQDRLEEAARAEGATTLRLPSGAGHDAMVLAHHVPAAMLFVPSRGGLSHTPEEFSAPEHCELGARVLARVVRALVLAV
jgi:N-carbamoyl-L-amino-acid hydrolase